MDRWSISQEPGISTDPNGEWVSYADAQEEMAVLRARVTELEAELEVARSLWQPPCGAGEAHTNGCCSCHGY